MKVHGVQNLSPLSEEIHLHHPLPQIPVAISPFGGLKGQPLMSKLCVLWDGRMQPAFPIIN